MITVDGQKMGKSLKNSITLDECFTGNHPSLKQAYAPATVRFFILQAHYRSTVDFSNEALLAAQKGLERLIEARSHLSKLAPAAGSSVDLTGLREKCEAALCDDLNTPVVISRLFDASRAINAVHDGHGSLSAKDLEELKAVFRLFIEDLLGLQTGAASSGSHDEAYGKAVDLLLSIRRQAKENRDWATSDRIRNGLAALGFKVKDTRDGAEWSI
jgi:cysteinyl-tRNA synthetase